MPINMLIKNFEKLALTKQRRAALEVLEAGLEAIQPEKSFAKNISLANGVFKIGERKINAAKFQNIFLIGFGKGSLAFSLITAAVLGDRLKKAFVIDVVKSDSPLPKNFYFKKGTHPLPSRVNIDFAKKIFKEFSNKLTANDLVIVVVCGGGSALFNYPSLSLREEINIDRALLKSGADIYEMNTVRKHLSLVKGGGLAKMLYPSTIESLIISDVLGNDVSFIASGPTVKDGTAVKDALAVLSKYGLDKKLKIKKEDLRETPGESKYFKNVFNSIVVSNLTALEAMKKKGKELGYKTKIFSDRLRGEASVAGAVLLKASKKGEILVAAGETTVTVKGAGKGGRNQEFVLGQIESIKKGAVIAAVSSDGWDNTAFAGAVGDCVTSAEAKRQGVDPSKFLAVNDSFNFFKRVEGGIITGRLKTNVADLMVVVNNKFSG